MTSFFNFILYLSVFYIQNNYYKILKNKKNIILNIIIQKQSEPQNERISHWICANYQTLVHFDNSKSLVYLRSSSQVKGSKSTSILTRKGWSGLRTLGLQTKCREWSGLRTLGLWTTPCVRNKGDLEPLAWEPRVRKEIDLQPLAWEPRVRNEEDLEPLACESHVRNVEDLQPLACEPHIRNVEDLQPLSCKPRLSGLRTLGLHKE